MALLSVAAMALTTAGCTDGARTVHPLPPRPPVLEIVMGSPGEYAFTLPPVIPVGRVVFRVRNAGRLDHHLVITPLPDSLPPLAEQLRGPTRVAARPFAGVPIRSPGSAGIFSVDLEAGRRYGVVCFVQDVDGQSHARKGMSAEFRAGFGRP